MNKLQKRILWVLCILALICPAGILLPNLFHAGGAWGEWNASELKQQTGIEPTGMKRHEKIWKAPMQNYKIGKKDKGIWWDVFSYQLAAFCGITVIGFLTFWITVKTRRQ